MNFSFLNWGRASLEGLSTFEGMHSNVVVVVFFSFLFLDFSILQCRQSHESWPSKRKFIQHWVINYKPDMKVRILGMLLYSWLGHLLNLLGPANPKPDKYIWVKVIPAQHCFGPALPLDTKCSYHISVRPIQTITTHLTYGWMDPKPNQKHHWQASLGQTNLATKGHYYLKSISVKAYLTLLTYSFW